MTIIRRLAFLAALLVPAVAAAQSTGASCCDRQASCCPGCPHCAH